MELITSVIVHNAKTQLRNIIYPGSMINAEFFDNVIKVIVEAMVNEINYQLDPQRILDTADTQLIERASILLAERAAQK